LGIAYQLSPHAGRETVLRGGFGLYYDLGYGEVGDAAASFPHTHDANFTNIAFPLSAQAAFLPPLPSLDPPYSAQFHAFAPNHQLPRIYQWNVTVDQNLGSAQTLSVSYVAALGRGLLRRTFLIDPNSRFNGSEVFVTGYDSNSNYEALQAQFQRRFAHGLAALLSYTWSHSIDDNSSNTGFDELLNSQIDRGSSDFDVRHNFHGAFTYTIPRAPVPRLLGSALWNWELDGIVAAQSGFPNSVDYGNAPDAIPEVIASRVDLVPGVPIYISDSHVPGGWKLNLAAFQAPPPTRIGTLGRNSIHGFPLVQTDFAISRQFNLVEALKLQFRVEFFNLFNHPNFSGLDTHLGDLGPPFVPDPFFGVATKMAGGQGYFSPLYDAGGSRSIQLALRVRF
jgi:hypothetical protein